MICSVCTESLELVINLLRLAMSPTTLPPDFEVSHHEDLKSFKSSLEQKCYVCTPIWESLQVDDRKEWEAAWIKYDRDDDSDPVHVTRFQMDFCQFIQSHNHTVGLRLYLPPGTPSATPAIISETFILLEPSTAERKLTWTAFSKPTTEPEPRLARPLLGPTTSSSVDLAKRWLDICVARHGLCKVEGTWFPTRLLYSTGGTIQLIETKETKPTTPYMTVTHRWGFADEEKMMLSKKTYSSLREGIPLSSMPKLFQEVISVALRLGVNYLWIDAFCIFQDKDDQADWHHEASQMQKVYSNSFCNISAADATSCSDTLFSQPRNPEEEILPQTILLNLTPAPPSSPAPSSPSSPTSASSFSSQYSSHLPSIMNPFEFRKLVDAAETRAMMTRPESFTVTDLSLWSNQVEHALVNTRAWVLQERVLASRILHFGRRQLFWECRHGQACEACPIGDLPRQMGFEGEVEFKLSISQRRVLKYGNQDDMRDAYGVWRYFVQTYTKTNLSFPSDKLIAISGLAKLIHDWTSGDDYLAGLWRRYLEGELLWVKSSPQHLGGKATTKRPQKYRAPSWSWASVDGHVVPGKSINHQDLGFMIRVEDVQLTYLTEDKMGEVTGGWLRLRGRLLETELVRVSCTDGTVGWMVKLEGVGVFDEGVQPAQGILDPRVYLDVMQEDFNKEREEGLLFSVVAKTGGKYEMEKMCMLLFKLADREKGVFQRLGIIQVAGDAMKKRVLEVKRGLDKPRLPCVELHEDGQHSILVI